MNRTVRLLASILLLQAYGAAIAQEGPNLRGPDGKGQVCDSDAPLVRTLEAGQRIFSAGHSFHMFIPNLLRTMAEAAEMEGHDQVGKQSIGGSRVIQHWDLADERNSVKQGLRAGQVDVLTLSPIYLPDEGIEKFVRLGLEHNPDIRVTIQQFWLPYDVYATDYKQRRPALVDRNSRTGEELRQLHAEYFRSMDDHAESLNQKFGKPVVFVVPVGQAAVALRERIIAGQAPGLTQQNDLFTDAIGHATAPLQALAAYCHFAVIYGRTPVGLPLSNGLAKYEQASDLNRLLQELAWDAVCANSHGSGTASSVPSE